jgi:hypothetical protein
VNKWSFSSRAPLTVRWWRAGLPLAIRSSKFFSYVDRREQHTDSADWSLTPCREMTLYAGWPPPDPCQPCQWSPCTSATSASVTHERQGVGCFEIWPHILGFWVHLSKLWQLTNWGVGCANAEHVTLTGWPVTHPEWDRFTTMHLHPCDRPIKWGDLLLRSYLGRMARCTYHWNLFQKEPSFPPGWLALM